MALATYSDLQASVASWMNRTDLTATIPDFIAICESRIQTDMRLRDQVTTSTLTTVANTQEVTLPADFLEFANLSIDGEPMEYVSASRIRELADLNHTGSPREPTLYSIEGNSLLLSPTPDTAYTINIKYYAKVPALATASTNWLLTKHPNIYLYGSLVSGYHFTMNDERANFFGALYAQAVQGAKAADLKALSSGSPLTIRTRWPR